MEKLELKEGNHLHYFAAAPCARRAPRARFGVVAALEGVDNVVVKSLAGTISTGEFLLS